MVERICSSTARTGTPDEIFAGVRFIVECGYFTGRCLDIDGSAASTCP